MDSLTPFIPPALQPFVEHLRTQGPLLGVALLSVGAAYLGYLFLLGRKEAAVSFNVPIPPEVRANWKGEKWDSLQGEGRKVVEGQVRGVSLRSTLPLLSQSLQPNAFEETLTCALYMQQWNDNLIMSYCPADGRVLGNGIKPATPDDVDRAVLAAKSAQLEWANTSFAERRKVLRTLLKCVLNMPCQFSPTNAGTDPEPFVQQIRPRPPR